MKKLFSIFTISLFMIPTSHALNMGCEIENSDINRIHSFAEDVMGVTNKLSNVKPVLAITVTKFGLNQGYGNVYVMTDKQGNVAGISVNFMLNGKTEVMSKTFDELKNGEKLEYTKGNEKNAALIVQKAYNSDIYSNTGGEFTFSILTKKPKTYSHHSLYLRNVSGKWVVRDSGGSVLESVDLTPNTKAGDAPLERVWDGTFSGADFD